MCLLVHLAGLLEALSSVILLASLDGHLCSLAEGIPALLPPRLGLECDGRSLEQIPSLFELGRGTPEAEETARTVGLLLGLRQHGLRRHLWLWLPVGLVATGRTSPFSASMSHGYAILSDTSVA